VSEDRPGPVAGEQAHHGRQVPSGAVSHDGDPAAVPAEIPRMICRPLQRGVRVVDGRGKRVLGGEPVRHRDDDRLHPGRHLAAEPVGHVQVAQAKPAAVVVQDQREGVGACLRRPVGAKRNGTLRAVSRHIGHGD
jgi:hypothetical protein